MPRIEVLLLDRDGTLISDEHYLSDPDKVRLLPGVGETLQHLTRKGLSFYVVSNQSGLGRGFFSHDELKACNDRMYRLLGEYQVGLQDLLYCPHLPDQGCSCRKPETGMWRDLQEAYDLVPGSTVMVGDKAEDLEFGVRSNLAGVILVLTGKGTATLEGLGLDQPSLERLSAEGMVPGPPSFGRVPLVVVKDFYNLPAALDLLGDQGSGP